MVLQAQRFGFSGKVGGLNRQFGSSSNISSGSVLAWTTSTVGATLEAINLLGHACFLALIPHNASSARYVFSLRRVQGSSVVCKSESVCALARDCTRKPCERSQPLHRGLEPFVSFLLINMPPSIQIFTPRRVLAMASVLDPPPQYWLTN